jgi:hypothetical protein
MTREIEGKDDGTYEERGTNAVLYDLGDKT